ncbi:glycosyl transferase family 11 [Litoreibacter ponti]|uniref:Glycosyl transferase family 11 n=1 Tax=Litoreibacter ponti TaxID=1510457 RepID=A0A2T6BL49_9RHOB|nr:alpha-1,2-fucosyltransferase [Litoreibacter ponti]PTX56800.1 glycosyl transferase family 11 [Litoreibacter ponti]
MIIARIFGGLGNQLFQYATARALAKRACAPLWLDIRLAPPGDHWEFALNHFAIEAKIAQPGELPPDKNSKLRYAAWRYLGGSPKFTRERGLGFNENILSLRGDVYLHGYFQSERYFEDFPGLRQELTIKTPPSDENRRWADDIRAVPSVSLHLRRGDYLTAKGAGSHASCDAAYYERALNHVAEKMDAEPKVFVFSDDPDWARDNLKLPFEMRVAGHNGSDKHYEDMRLISICRHNIIANSTFSWWGAWLNDNPDKVVVAPKVWFANPKLANPDITPESWIRL